MVSEPRSTHCPPLEEIAALVDGRLSGPDRDRVVAHVTDCADCYAVLAGTMEFLEQEDEAGSEDEGKAQGRAAARPFLAPVQAPVEPIQLPPTDSLRPIRPPTTASRKPRDWGWMLRLAASVFVGVGAGWLLVGMRQMPSGAAEKWVAATSVENAEPFPWNRLRSADEPKPESRVVAFLAGVHVIDLQLLLTRDQREKAVDTFRELKKVEDAAIEVASLTSLTDLAEVEDALEAWYRDAGSKHDYELGKWAEAGWLAAQARGPSHFARGSLSRRFLSWTLKHLEDQEDQRVSLLEGVSEKMKSIDSLVQSEVLGEEELEELADNFEKIIRLYESYSI